MNIDRRLDRMEEILKDIQITLAGIHSPAASLSIHEKAAAIRKAIDTGDKKILRQTMKEINGEQ